MSAKLEGAAVVGQTIPFDFSGRRVHFVGIGGCGMSGTAKVLLSLGARVSGSDQSSFDGLGELVTAGAIVAVGHREQQLPHDTQLVVRSAAVPDSNPELVAAQRCGVKIIKYAELLGMLMKDRRGVAIAGTHGKSTTTAMTAHLFRSAGLDPSFVIGARSPQLGGSCHVGAGPHWIVESCEFDRSFLHLRPHSAAVLNIETDHIDCYESLDEIVEAFAQFVAQIEEGGLFVCNADDPVSKLITRRASARVETFGFSEDADWRPEHMGVERGMFAFDVAFRGHHVLSTRLSIPGRYNVANAMAAIALACHAGADLRKVAEALPAYAGVSRRLTFRGNACGVTILDDYAHHPTEIKVTIEAAKYRYEPKRTWVVFQPHQYSRTRHFLEQFADSFGEADEIIVPDVYGARETNVQEEHAVGSAELVDRIRRRGGHAQYMASLQEVANYVIQNVSAGDLVLTMGAGDVWRVADELVERICRPDRTGRTDRYDDLVPAGRKSAAPVPA